MKNGALKKLVGCEEVQSCFYVRPSDFHSTILGSDVFWSLGVTSLQKKGIHLVYNKVGFKLKTFVHKSSALTTRPPIYHMLCLKMSTFKR